MEVCCWAVDLRGKRDVIVCPYRRTDDPAALSIDYSKGNADSTLSAYDRTHYAVDKSGVGAGKGSLKQMSFDTRRTNQREVSFGLVVSLL